MKPAKGQEILAKWERHGYQVVHITVQVGKITKGDLNLGEAHGRIWAFSPEFPHEPRLIVIERIATELYESAVQQPNKPPS